MKGEMLSFNYPQIIANIIVSVYWFWKEVNLLNFIYSNIFIKSVLYKILYF